MAAKINPVTRTIPRNLLAQLLPNERAVRAFEDLQFDMTETVPDAIGAIGDIIDQIVASPVIVWQANGLFANDRLLGTTSALALTVTDERVIVGLSETGVTAGGYGSAAKTVSFQVDGYGRILSAEAYDLISDNVAEGVSNLYYTDARARSALSQGQGISYNPETGEIATAIVTAAGLYTPTLTNATNVTATRAHECQYTRVGDVVIVSGRVDVQATTAGAQTHVGISLPIPSAFTAAAQCGGTAAAISATGQVAGVQADHLNDWAALSMIPSSTAMQNMFFIFQYRVL